MTEGGGSHPFRGTLGGARPDVLICAGLDPSGGAGIIADVRVVSELGGRPVGVVTALTVQNTTAVIDTEAMAAALVREQLEFLLSDVEVRAVKIGMIGSSEIAKSISQALALTGAPVVWDPVIHPSRGDVPFVDSLFSHALAALRPHVTVLTPNVQELVFLTGAPVASLADAVAAGQALAARLGTAVLVKGGHLAGASPGGPPTGARATLAAGSPQRSSEASAGLGPAGSPQRSSEASAGLGPAGSPQRSSEASAGLGPAGSSSGSHENRPAGTAAELPVGGLAPSSAPSLEASEPSAESIDALCRPTGGVELLRGRRVPDGHHVHGTGCALSSALATYLALGFDLVAACRAAKAFVGARIAAASRPGRGAAAIV